MDNNETLEFLGAICIGILMLAIPILLTCSFVYEWSGFIRVMLCFALIFDFAFIVSAIIAAFSD